jgi:hypothetical protein
MQFRTLPGRYPVLIALFALAEHVNPAKFWVHSSLNGRVSQFDVLPFPPPQWNERPVSQETL